MKKFLFICTMNKLRSLTAETIFSEYVNIEVKSAGIDINATKQIKKEDIIWSDIIFVMEKYHRNKISKKFKEVLKSKRIIVLDILDEYKYMDEELIRILKNKVSRYL